MASTRPRILIVDDDPEIRDLLRLRLQSRYDVVTAANGHQALAEIGRSQPDLLVLDIIMPDVDGIMVTKLLRSVPETETMPIILITALDTSENRAAGLQVGADDCLGKPFEAAELLARIDLVLRRTRRGGSSGRRRSTAESSALLTGVSLPIILQMLHLDRKSCELRVTAGDRAGALTLQRGELVAARYGDEEGEEAFHEIFGWPDARTEIWDARTETERTILTPLPHLLMEAVRRQDEASRLRGEPPDFVDPPSFADAGPSEGTAPLRGLTLEPPPSSVQVTGATDTTVAAPAASRSPKPPALSVVTGSIAEIGRETARAENGTPPLPGRFPAASIRAAGERIRAITGFLGGALVDRADTALIAAPGADPAISGLDLAAAARGTSRLLDELTVNEPIEDVEIAFAEQLHLICPLPGMDDAHLHLVFDQSRTNLALARLLLDQIVRDLVPSER